MGQGERIMDILWMYLLGCTVAVVLISIWESAKSKAYWEGRRAGYARGIADSRNNITQ